MKQIKEYQKYLLHQWKMIWAFIFNVHFQMLFPDLYFKQKSNLTVTNIKIKLDNLFM